MSMLTTLARVEAAASGRARPLSRVRHRLLTGQPLVIIPLTLAGDPATPVAAMTGTSRISPHLLVVSQPRNRDLRLEFLASLASTVLSYVTARQQATEVVPATRNREERHRYADAPQILVPNKAARDYLGLLGRATRFQQTDGPYAVDPAIPALGKWLTFFADRAGQPGSALLADLTSMLAEHWASGQSPLEDHNLAALLGWIDPPDGMSGERAALLAEDPAHWPSAGPATDPEFDAEVLSPLISAQQDADGDPAAERIAEDALRAALRERLTPTWDLMWHGIDLLRELPEAGHGAHRWMVDRGRFTDFARGIDEGAPPQPRRESAVAAARRLADLESAQESYDKQRALDDPLILAGYRVTGEAFAGTVVAVDAERQDTTGRTPKPRPHVWLRTPDPVVLRKGTKVACSQRPNQRPVIVAVTREDAEYVVELELVDGMGRRAVPEEGSVPEAGEYRCYSTVLAAERFPPPPLPEPAATPWTHGGPPADYAPTGADHDEEWH